MNCPSCTNEMIVHALGARLAARVEIDACETCQAFWFDSSESPRLSPASTLELFSLTAETLPRRTGSVARVLKCPRCRSRLLEMARVRREIDAAFAGSHGTVSLWSEVSSIGLVGAGLSAVARLLKN